MAGNAIVLPQNGANLTLASGDVICMQADNGNYVTLSGDEDIKISPDKQEPDDYCKFTVTVENGFLWLQASSGNYLHMVSDGHIKANQKTRGEYSNFTPYEVATTSADLPDHIYLALYVKDGFVSEIGREDLKKAKPGIDRFCMFRMYHK